MLSVAVTGVLLAALAVTLGRRVPAAVDLVVLLEDQAMRWASGERPLIEEYLAAHPGLLSEVQRESLIELVCSEFTLRYEWDESPDPEDYARRFPVAAEAVRRQAEACLAFSVPVPPGFEPLSPPVEVVPGYTAVARSNIGGMGIVYKARDARLPRFVALKILRSDRRLSAMSPASLIDEARRMALLSHPEIVKILDIGDHKNQSYLIMEWIGGANLGYRLLEYQRKHPRDVAELMAKVARAVHHAHCYRVWHCDLKPANILVDAGGHPRVADFGLGRTGLGRPEELGRPAGSPGYMAPEQVDGREIPTLTDVYGLGAVLYTLLTGVPPRPPPHGERSLADHVRALRVNSPPIVPPRRRNRRASRDLEAICLKCLQHRPQDRYRTAEEVARSLELFQQGMPIPERRGPLEVIGKAICRRPLTASLAAACLLLGVLGLVVHNRTLDREIVAKDTALQHAREALAERDRHDRVARESLANLLRTFGLENLGGVQGERISPLVARLPGYIFADEPRAQNLASIMGAAVSAYVAGRHADAVTHWVRAQEEVEALRRTHSDATLLKKLGEQDIPIHLKWDSIKVAQLVVDRHLAQIRSPQRPGREACVRMASELADALAQAEKYAVKWSNPDLPAPGSSAARFRSSASAAHAELYKKAGGAILLLSALSGGAVDLDIGRRYLEIALDLSRELVPGPDPITESVSIAQLQLMLAYVLKAQGDSAGSARYVRQALQSDPDGFTITKNRDWPSMLDGRDVANGYRTLAEQNLPDETVSRAWMARGLAFLEHAAAMSGSASDPAWIGPARTTLQNYRKGLDKYREGRQEAKVQTARGDGRFASARGADFEGLAAEVTSEPWAHALRLQAARCHAMACAAATRGGPDTVRELGTQYASRSFTQLEQSLAGHYLDPAYLEKDSDLEGLRRADAARFREIVGRARREWEEHNRPPH